MFYSQTFLARKGPLSTVWIAAHLQHRLKKSQYASTDIPSTVQHIMDPGVPIALRMSAHLLLGVVRIYSKKVDYLLNDCNLVRTVLYKVFASVSNNTLPEDARQAPVHSITMPATFDLDALNLGYEIDINGYEDVHMRNQDEITLADRSPIVLDNYVTIRFDEDITFGSSNAQPPPDSDARPQPPPDSDARPNEEEIIPQSPSTNVVNVQDGCPSSHMDVQDGGPSFHTESHTTGHTSGDNHHHNFQDPITKQTMPMETFLDPSNDNDTIGNPPDHLGFNDTVSNMDIDQHVNEKDQTPEMIDEIHAGPSSTEPPRPPTPAASQDGGSDAVHGGRISEPTLERGFSDARLIPTPQMEQQMEQGQDQRHQRGRRRNQFYDDPIVLPNRVMKKALNDTRNIRRRRRDVSTSFATWESKSKRLKEGIFDQPLFTGLCQELINIHKREYICSKPHLVISEEDHPDNTTSTPPINQVADEPIADAPEIIVNASGVEDIEHIRSVADDPLPTIPTQSMDTEPITEGAHKSPAKGGLATPTSVSEAMEIPYGATSPRAHASEIGSPSTYPDNIFQNHDFSDNILHNHDFSDTNQLINSAEKDELWFLEEDNNTPATASSQSTSKSIDTLSGRTRGLAQYLKDYSPCTTIPEHPAEDFCLNKILDGKTRKIAARMFFEVLVLKTHDLIDVQQEEPYGDVSFKLTPTLAKAKI